MGCEMTRSEMRATMAATIAAGLAARRRAVYEQGDPVPGWELDYDWGRGDADEMTRMAAHALDLADKILGFVDAERVRPPSMPIPGGGS